MAVDNNINARLLAELQRAGLTSSESGEFEADSGADSFGSSRVVPVHSPEALNGASVSHLLAAGFEALDLLKIGLAVCSASGEVLAANETAETILRSRDGLERDSDGILCATQGKPEVLRDIIRDLDLESRNAEPRDRAISLTRPSGRRALTLFVHSVNGNAGRRATPEASAVVMILDSELPSGTAESDLRQLYGLTATEAQLSNLLMEGLAIEECCSKLGIRRTTARMHLRNIFAKTGVRRQGELVSLLLKSIGLGPRLK